MITVETRRDTTVLDRLLRTAPAMALSETIEAAEDVVKDIRSNWSAASPSAPGAPPAKVTGELDMSLDVRVQKASGKVQVAILVFAEHGKHLEFGTYKMKARPFVRPAMKRAERFKGRWKVVTS